MKKLRLAAFSSFCLALALPLPGFAQTPTLGPGVGMIPHAPYSYGTVDRVNLSNGNLVVDIPLVSLPQRGKLSPLTFSLVGNSQTFQEYEVCDTNDNCSDYVDYAAVPGAIGISVASSLNPINISSSYYEWTVVNCPSEGAPGGCNPSDYPYNSYDYFYAMYYSVPDPTGSQHQMVLDSSTLNGPQYVMRALDGSGYTFTTTSEVYNASYPSVEYGQAVTGTLYDANGTTYVTPPITNECFGCLATQTTATDTSGNTMVYQDWYTDMSQPISASNPVSLYVDSLAARSKIQTCWRRLRMAYTEKTAAPAASPNAPTWATPSNPPCTLLPGMFLGQTEARSPMFSAIPIFCTIAASRGAARLRAPSRSGPSPRRSAASLTPSLCCRTTARRDSMSWEPLRFSNRSCSQTAPIGASSTIRLDILFWGRIKL